MTPQRRGLMLTGIRSWGVVGPLPLESIDVRRPQRFSVPPPRRFGRLVCRCRLRLRAEEGLLPALARGSGRTDDGLLVLNVELDLRPEAALFEPCFGNPNALLVPDPDDPRPHDDVR